MWIWSLKITSTGKLFFGYYSRWCPMNWLFFIWRKNVSNVRPSSMLSTTLFLILQKKSVLFIRSINTIMKFWCASSLLNNFWNLPMIIMLPFACQFLLKSTISYELDSNSRAKLFFKNNHTLCIEDLQNTRLPKTKLPKDTHLKIVTKLRTLEQL